MAHDTETIRRLNDEVRKNPARRVMVITSGIAALGPERVQNLMQRIADFDDFTENNNPHSENDFGAIEIGGYRAFFKLEYYNLSMDGHSPDAADPAVTTRVLTVMLANEY